MPTTVVLLAWMGFNGWGCAVFKGEFHCLCFLYIEEQIVKFCFCDECKNALENSAQRENIVIEVNRLIVLGEGAKKEMAAVAASRL